MKKKFIYSFVLMNLGFSFVYSGGENNREDFIEKLMHDYNYVCQVNDELRKEIASLEHAITMHIDDWILRLKKMEKTWSEIFSLYESAIKRNR